MGLFTLTSMTNSRNSLGQIHRKGCSHIARTYASVELDAKTLEDALQEALGWLEGQGDLSDIHTAACCKS
jgi:hypothetical protein